MTEIATRTIDRKLSSEGHFPRLGFLGVGWIGQNRLEAIGKSGVAQLVAVCDSSREAVQRSLEFSPGAQAANSFDELLDADLDAVVIATPSAQHAEQCMRALERGMAVFCQKPLGRTAAETQAVIEVAQRADRLLAVDLAYRFTAAMQAVHSLVNSGDLGEIYAANLVFHNAYGPDKPWFYDRALAGGGCVIDLGIHLVDAALWMLGFPAVREVTSRLYRQGKPLSPPLNEVEDYASARLDLATGTTVDLACSWRLPAGQDCVIAAEFYGTKGGASFRNVNGSFYDFIAERFEGTKRTRLASPPDGWPGRAAVAWASHLRSRPGFDPANHELLRVAEVLDLIYGHPSRASGPTLRRQAE